MKKYLVIGNPIEHSLSPKLHNYWIKQNNINASYEKILISENDIENIISKIKSEEITGINVAKEKASKTPLDNMNNNKMTNCSFLLLLKNLKIDLNTVIELLNLIEIYI